MVSDDPRDQALRFLTTLHGEHPHGLIAVTVAPNWARPHCVMTPVDALPYVVGKPDVFVRIGLVEHPPRARGSEQDTISIPGVWCEIDITGAPSNTNGRLVDGGARDLDHAIQVAHCVLPPTMLVASGHGVHAYWLFEEPLRLSTSDDRARAKELVHGWQLRMGDEALLCGVAHIDSTHDLARVFRIPGSLNTKGAEAQHVQLL